MNRDRATAAAEVVKSMLVAKGMLNRRLVIYNHCDGFLELRCGQVVHLVRTSISEDTLITL